jgi:deaminated glutathione amidase
MIRNIRAISIFEHKINSNLIKLNERRRMIHKIAIFQLNCKGDKEENFNVCKKLITEAQQEGAKMMFLPENCDFIESTTQAMFDKSEPIDGEFIKNFQKLASDLKVWISIGSFHRKDNTKEEKKILNSHIIVDDNGEIKTVYDKLHLFEINHKNKDGSLLHLKESDCALFGQKLEKPTETPIGKIGVSIVISFEKSFLS